jgi:hypothetical protein
MAMAGKLLPDKPWNEIAPLFPEDVPSPEGCHAVRPAAAAH